MSPTAWLFRHLVAVGELFGKVPETLGSVELVRKYIPGVGIESSHHLTPLLFPLCFVFAVEEAVPHDSPNSLDSPCGSKIKINTSFLKLPLLTGFYHNRKTTNTPPPENGRPRPRNGGRKTAKDVCVGGGCGSSELGEIRCESGRFKWIVL